MNTSKSRDKTMSKQEYLSQPLRSLPELPVLRDSYCSQETVNRIVRWIHDNHPEWLMKLLAEESGNRAGHYLETSELLSKLKKHAYNEVEGVTPYLGEIDLIYEIDRRLRKAYDFSELLPRGKPLAPSPNGPFPPMLVLKISPINEKRGATQEIVDTVLADFYNQRPDLWFAAGEAAQRRLGFGIASGGRYSILRKIILKRGFAEDIHHKHREKGDLSSLILVCKLEFQIRVRAMCETPVIEHLP
jgi:hypothetical protein